MPTRGNSVWPQKRSLEVENGAVDLRHEAVGNEVTVGAAWLWCITGCLAGWMLVAWAVDRLV